MTITYVHGDDAPARLLAAGYRQTFEAFGQIGRGYKTTRAKAHATKIDAPNCSTVIVDGLIVNGKAGVRVFQKSQPAPKES